MKLWNWILFLITGRGRKDAAEPGGPHLYPCAVAPCELCITYEAGYRDGKAKGLYEVGTAMATMHKTAAGAVPVNGCGCAWCETARLAFRLMGITDEDVQTAKDYVDRRMGRGRDIEEVT